MKNQQKPQTVTLASLLDRLRDGRYVIPDFQREFEWDPWDIRDLIRSVFLDYYIGSLLLWKGTPQSFEDLSCQPVYGVDSGRDRDLIVLDGQQRLTALHYAFHGPRVNLPNRKSPALFLINVEKFSNEQYDDAFHYWYRSRNNDAFLKSHEDQYRTHMFPCELMGKGWDVVTWVKGYESYWNDRLLEHEANNELNLAEEAREHRENAIQFGNHVRELLNSFQISYIELDNEIPIDVVCDIFTKLNSKGVRLDVFDLLNALVKPKGVQLKELWRAAKDRLDFIGSDKLNIYVLQVFSILRQEYCSPKYLYYLIPGQVRRLRTPDGTRTSRVVVEDEADFHEGWYTAVHALERAISTIRNPHEYGAVSKRFVPYAGIFPVFAALLHTAHALPFNQRLAANTKIREWYWASVFNSRYSGSTESTSTTDFRDLLAWFQDDASKPEWIEKLDYSLRDIDLENQFNTGSSTYKGVFNLLIKRGARDWSTGMIPEYQSLDDHHIVPQSWGKENLPDGRINTVLNRSPLSSETNRLILRDQLPNKYLRQMLEDNGRSKVEEILASHLISPSALDILLRDPFTPADFDEFIRERRTAVQDELASAIGVSSAPLSPALEALDDRVRIIEKSLRTLVAKILDHDVNRIPPTVKVNIENRIDTESRKDPSFDPGSYRELEAMLEFSDLRELQQAVTAKSAWNDFQPLFLNKPDFENRFDKLASLRNGIRHDRSVTSQMRTDGEASIQWFETVLRRSDLKL